MADRETHEDRLADLNLRKIGRALPLPATPTDQQRRTWKQGPRLRFVPPRGQAVPIQARGGFFMRNRRFVLPAGSAIAAGLMLAVLFMTPTSRSVVNAATIIDSLRATVHQGLHIRLEKLVLEDVHLDGEVNLLFAEPFSLADVISDDAVEPELGHLSFALNVMMGPDAKELPGLDLEAAGRLAPGDKWVFVKFHNLDPLVEQAGPALLLFAPGLTNGLLVELDDVIADDELRSNGNVRHDNDHGNGERIVRGTLQAGVARDADGDTYLEIGGDVAGPNMLDLGPAVIREFLAGQASPEQLEQIIAELEKIAGEVRIRHLGGDRYELLARDFSRLADETPAGEEVVWLPALVVRIGYRQGLGVDSLRLENVGSAQGVVAVEFIDTPDASTPLRREDYTRPGVTVLNPAALERSLEKLIGSQEARGAE